MVVTINTDASYSHTKQKGGYAFWIVCNRGKLLKSGAIKSPESSVDCEIKAIANALYLFQLSDLNHKVTKIIINTDCQPAIYHIRRNSNMKIGKWVHKKIKSIRRAYMFNRPEFVFRHVKAHSGKNDARSWVNEWCDKEAKKFTR